MKKILKLLSVVSISLIMACLVFFPDKYIPIAADGIKLWAINVLPSLFPFFFFSLLLTKIGSPHKISSFFNPLTQRLFRCNGTIAYIFFMSVLSGYPVGAKLISELSKQGVISKNEATRAATLCSTSGPLFVIGTVGTVMFSSKSCGIVLFISHILSAVICGIIFGRIGNFKKSVLQPHSQNKSENILYECIYSSVISILCVGGFVCVFYIISQIASSLNLMKIFEVMLSFLLKKNPHAKDIANGFIYGLIECTAGCKSLSSHPCPISASLAGGLISFGGISIIFQSVIYLSEAKVNLKIFFLSKVIQTLITFSITLALLLVLKIF